MGFEHLIIGGANKAGTTSLYRYLAVHPDVCTSVVKQSFYFLDSELQESLGLRSLHPYSPEPGSYERLFFAHRSPGQRTLDASPEYLFSPGTPGRIRSLLGDNAGVVFVLRDPAERMLSLFRFGKQQGSLATDMTLEEFIDAAVAYQGAVNPSLMGYTTGRYSTFLERYYALFPREALRVVFFEELIADPGSVATALTVWAGLDPTPVAGQPFEAHNVTVAVRSQRLRSAYLALRGLGFRASTRSALMRGAAGPWRRFVSPLYRWINTRTGARSGDEEQAALARLAALFEGEAERVEAIVGRAPQWS